MQLTPDIESQIRLQRWAGYLTIAVAFISFMVLAGWQFDIAWMKRPLTSLPAMNPATAIAFLFSSVSFYGLTKKDHKRTTQVISIICAGIVLAIGALKTIHAFSNLHIPVDTLLYSQDLERDQPGNVPNRMAPNTAICFVFMGISLLALHIKQIRRFAPVQISSGIISLIALLGLLGYFYNVTTIHGVFTYIPMAAHTAFCFLLFSISIFFIEPGKGVMKEFTSIYTGSSTARLLIPAAIIIPIILGLSRLYGHWNGMFTVEFGLAILVLSIIVAFLVLIWYSAYILNRKDLLRARAEQQSNQLGHLVEQTSDAVFSTDTDRRIKNWNKAAEEMYGYSAGEAIGKTILELLRIKEGPESHDKSMATLQRIGYYKGEYQATQRSGEIVYIHASVSTLKNEQGHITGYVAVHRDITERKKKETLQQQFNDELTRQVEEKTILVKNILERVSDGFYSLDEQWCFTYINTYAATIMGHKPEYLIGKSLWAEYPEATENPIYAAFNKAYDEQKQAQLEIYYEPFQKWFMVHVYPSPTGISVFFRDFSEIRNAEAEMKRSSERFDLISRTTNDAIWEWDFESGELWGNETHQHLYGLTMNDKVPDEKEWQERLHPNDREALIKRQADALASDTNVFITDYRFRTEKNGYRNIYDRCYIVRNDEGKATRILGSMMDVTERTQAEEKLRRRESQLLASIENTPNVAVQWYNDKGEVLFWNHASELIFGWGATEAVGKTLDQLIHTKEEAGGFLKTLEYIGQTGKTIGPSEYSFHRKDGSAGYCMATIFSIPSIGGEPCFVCMDIDITESKKAEEKIKESEERYKALVENAVEALVELDVENGKFVSVSESAVQLFKMTKEELLKIGPVDVSPEFQPDGRPSSEIAREKIQLAIEGQKPSFEWTHCDANGDPIACEIRLVRLPGEKVMIRGSIIDITERKKAEQTIVTSEETKRLIMNSALDAIVCIDKTGLITVWTPQAEKTFGWTIDEAIGKRLTETIIPERYKEAHMKGFANYLKTGVGNVLNRLVEISAVHKNGKEFPIELTITPITQGKSEFFCAFIRDISERKEAEAAVKRSEEKYRTLVEQAIDAIALYDASGKILDVNTGSVNLLNYSKEELTGMLLKDILTEEEIKSNPVRYDVLQDGNSTVKQRKMRRKDGIIVETEVRSQQLPDGRFLSVIRDLTERIKAERELAASYDAIRKLTDHIQNVREEERTNIAREIHDELGQQLTVLKMDISWLKKRIQDKDEAVKQKLKDLLSMLDETVRTVRRISSELRPSLLDDLGLTAAIEWHLKEFEQRSSLKTTLKATEVSTQLPDYIKTGLFRIFQESLTNVARHANAKNVEVALDYDGTGLILRIVDDGKGFDKRSIDIKTLGILGMKERTTMMGGTYEIESEPGKGTVVLVKVPLNIKEVNEPAIDYKN